MKRRIDKRRHFSPWQNLLGDPIDLDILETANDLRRIRTFEDGVSSHQDINPSFCQHSGIVKVFYRKTTEKLESMAQYAFDRARVDGESAFLWASVAFCGFGEGTYNRDLLGGRVRLPLWLVHLRRLARR